MATDSGLDSGRQTIADNKNELCLLSLQDEKDNNRLKVPVLLPGIEARENDTITLPETCQTAQNYQRSQGAVVRVVADSVEPKELVRNGLMDKELAKEFAGQKFSYSATGFFISPEGWLVTNNHVTSQKGEYSAQWPDGHKVMLKKIYQNPKVDLAILKIDWTEPVNVPYLSLSKDDSPSLEETVTIVGYPNQWKSLHCSPGNVIALDKRGNFMPNAWAHKMVKAVRNNLEVIRTNCHDAPGGSGSPTLNRAGEVVGINFAGPAEKDDCYTSCSFAIPVKHLKDAVKNIPELKERFAGH